MAAFGDACRSRKQMGEFLVSKGKNVRMNEIVCKYDDMGSL